MSNTKSLYWKLCCTVFILLSALTFTPLVISPERIEPMFAGMPYTLWTSILIAFVLLLLTFIGTRVHCGEDTDQGQQK